MRNLVGAAAILLAVTGLAGCGDDDPDEVAACADLKGETIEAGFGGCLRGDELQTVSGVHDCVDGRVLTVVGDEVGWAFEGEEWHKGKADDAVLECYGSEQPEPTDEPSDEPSDDPTGDTTDEPTEEPGGDAVQSQQCSDIWVEGQILPKDYDGCRDGRTRVLAAVFSCEDGSKLTSYDDRFYAFLGEEIRSSADEEAYADAFRDCLG